jgi:GT2 family glycosyltransferase
MIHAPEPLISIITVTYNNHDVTCDFLRSLNKVTYRNFEVIVVDNASKEDPEQKYTNAYPGLIYIRSETNLGFAGGNNLGIKKSKGDLLFFVNNDTELSPSVFEGLVAIFQQQPKAGAVSPKFHYYHHPEVIEYAGYEKVSTFTGKNKMIGCKEKDSGQYDKVTTTCYTHGGGMMVPKKVIDEIGMMPEVFFLYYEEFDWCEKIVRAGYDIYYQPNSLVYHKESMSVGKASTLKTYYLNRNRILFMRRNRSWLELTLFLCYFSLLTLPKNTSVYLIKGEMQHLKAFMKGIAWHFSRWSVKKL